MLIGLTGTPGTGKSSLSNFLETNLGYNIIHLNEMIKNENLYKYEDEERDSVVADMDKISERVSEITEENNDKSVTILESHLSHYIADNIIVLRASPEELEKRLTSRGYSNEKIQENVDAEELDVILFESVEWCSRVFEVDTTNRPLNNIVSNVDEIITALLNDNIKDIESKYKPGSVDWTSGWYS
ncbi:Adenylate kinase [Methanohalobium evestigatum Z-7303]|uniref:Putative adenylate kinase n=1 Tax=Methanohalobium evestigatum (strain ATCC BAA-1072 / DSM 3721 / NBRC 107634 / OCM 161 / Z-7303) TaxID=644295 RepID=D7EBI7_METEZ|nr:adenylate kinase family protein [Methanohalobium evestigatum]ADI74829.1 Adenylate kinase [Methanohalobium evestigatum Z-7303]